MLKDRNTPLEALRFLFMLVLCMIHYDYDFSITSLYHGYFVVEFFFMVSVFFIYTTYQKHPEIGCLDYTINKGKKFVIPVSICLLLQMLLDRKTYFYLPETVNADTLLDKYFSHMHEFLFLQSIGLTDNKPIIFPLWFISVLIVGGGILFSLLRQYGQKSVSLLIPVLILFGINYNSKDGNVLVANSISYVHGIYPVLVRGITAMGIGIITSYVYNNKIHFIRKRWLFDFLGIVSLCGFIMLLFAKGNYDYMLTFLIPMILISCFESSLFNKCLGWQGFIYLGNLSMYMFFVHVFVVSFVCILNIRLSQYGLKIDIFAYLLMVLFASWLLKFTSVKITKKMNLT